MYVRQQRGSVVNLYSITLHNGQTRNRTDLVLDGEGAESNLCGLVIADKEQRVDNNTLIDHRAEYCVSNQLYKYVMDERSVGAFAGRILVRQGAQHTISNERNANLCATKEARMYSQPMLEIYADDVKCSHGSTVGQLMNRPCSTCSSAASAAKRHRCCSSSLLRAKSSTPSPWRPCATACTIWWRSVSVAS